MELIDRQAAIDAVMGEPSDAHYPTWYADIIYNLPSAEPVRCKDCKHNPKDEWFGCPMSHLSETQRPETAWCWKAERRTENADVNT